MTWMEISPQCGKLSEWNKATKEEKIDLLTYRWLRSRRQKVENDKKKSSSRKLCFEDSEAGTYLFKF